MQIALTTAAKNLEKKWTLQEKPQEHRSSEHMFKVSDLVFLYNTTKSNLNYNGNLAVQLLQELGTRKLLNPRVNIGDLKLKDPVEESILEI